jgi:hypothetical protein
MKNDIKSKNLGHIVGIMIVNAIVIAATLVVAFYDSIF